MTKEQKFKKEYAIIRRYEEGTFELDADDLKKAYELAEVTLKWAQKTCVK